MKAFLATSALSVLLLPFAGVLATPQAQQPPAPASVDAQPAAPTGPNGVVATSCVRCHSDARMRGNLSLEGFDVSAAGDHAEVAEKMIRKLRAGMMPPPGTRRPEAERLLALVEALEEEVEESAALEPNPGTRSFQRLNRPEYARAIEGLLSLDVDAENWLPLDEMSANFDNMAVAQRLSPTLLEAYLNAAAAISRMAVGDKNAPTIDETYTNTDYISQHPWNHVGGAPYGTRGGMVVDHVFPADAEYVFEMRFASGSNARFEEIDVSINGERVAVLPWERGVPIRTEPILVRAGQHRVSAAFVRLADGPYEDLIRPHDWSMAGGGSGGAGVTTLPHLKDLVVSGPYATTGLSDTPSRQRIFTCRPTVPSEERPCAEQILSRIGSDAYRRPLAESEVDGLMPFYDTGAAKGGFELGVRTALEAILASPYFVLRLEREPEDATPDSGYRVGDLDLAFRLSFFLWGTSPDATLKAVAAEGRLSEPVELERQTRRMLADPQRRSVGVRASRRSGFVCRISNKVRPDPNFYPNFDENLADAMRRETELFFDHLVQEDRSLFELYDADYTFVNERLARHYGIPDVVGSHFRKVSYADERRRGILGHGSVLVLTSLANRTSPVLRGKWVMEVLLGTPPPPPPPNVPTLDETEGAKDGRLLTTRERMEQHRTNPTCNACHRFMDPIGLALDNFDVTAKWRQRENGTALDTRGELYDGTPVATPGELVDALLKRPIPLVRTFTENLLAYALGRRVEVHDQPTVRAIARAAEAEGYRVTAFILGVVKSDAFQMKREHTVTTDEAAAVAPQ